MQTTVFRYPCADSLMQLRRDECGRWGLHLNGREVCNYSSPEKAAHFVALGRTGEPAIDQMRNRPRVISDWD
jgi:hypothetical protein